MGTTESDWTFHQVFGDRGEDIDFQDIAEGMCKSLKSYVIHTLEIAQENAYM